MLKKTLATLVAFLLGLGLAISAVSPGYADDTAPSGAVDSPAAEPAPSADPTPPTDPAPPADATADSDPEPAAASAAPAVAPRPTARSSSAPRLYGVALYLYKKVDPLLAPSWENSGLQTLVAQDVDNTSAASNEYWTSYPGYLPTEVCGDDWAVQQDKISFTGSYSFPPEIQYPVDNIGWPPIYEAKHQPLGELVAVPPCAIEPTIVQAGCTVDGSYTLPLVNGVSWTVNGEPKPAGTYPVEAGSNLAIKGVATAQGILPGSTRDSQTGKWSRTWTFSLEFPTCRDPRLLGTITSVCVDDAPLIAYSVTLDDPDAQSTGNTAVLSLTDGDETFTFPSLGDIHHGETLTGELLWPGASRDPITGAANGWPGWEFVGGLWQETSGNFAWTRDGVTAEIDVNPGVSASLEYPPGDPDCYPGPREVTPTLTSVEASCEKDGSYTLPLIDGIRWRVDGDVKGAGTYPGDTPSSKHVVAELVGPYVFADGVQTEWTLAFDAPDECLTLAGSTVTGKCEADSPWIYYDIALTDPYDVASDHDAELIMTSGADSVVIPLGTVDPATNTLSDRVLWPGASVDPVTGEANGWPGWVEVDGVWEETTGNFAWTRSITTAVISVNPTLNVSISYPPATPSCAMIPTLGLFPTDAHLDEQCTDDGEGVLTLGQVDGVSFFEDVNYFIDGVPATSSTVHLAPGTYLVTVTTKHATDGLDGPTAWRIVVTGGEVCGELETLALTGAAPLGWLVFAGLLLAAGAGAVTASVLRLRRTS